jgi:hypothetical protein
MDVPSWCSGGRTNASVPTLGKTCRRIVIVRLRLRFSDAATVLEVILEDLRG